MAEETRQENAVRSGDDVFEKVQEIRQQRYRMTSTVRSSIFSGQIQRQAGAAHPHQVRRAGLYPSE